MSKSGDPSTRGPSKKRGGAEREGARSSAKRTKPPARGIAGVPGSKNPERRCTAIVASTGERCKRAAIRGGFVCTSHGGAAPQVKKKARERLAELVDPFITELRRIVMESDADDSVKLRGIIALLDRTGYGPGAKLEVGLSKWDDMIATLAQGGIVELDRSMPLGELDRGMGAGEHGWEDVAQHQADLTRENFAEQDAEDERPWASRVESAGAIPGEVVGRYDDPRATDPPAHLADVLADDDRTRTARVRRG